MANTPRAARRWGRHQAALRSLALTALFASACGPSEREVALAARADRLEQQLDDARQRAEDLQVRVRTIRARNKVLIGLVQGLTADPEQAPTAQQPHDAPAPMAKATRALEALDRDLDVLASSLRRSREDFVELHGERRELETHLAEAMETIEASRTREAQAQQRVDTFRQMLVKLHAMIRAAKLEVRIVRNRMVVQLPDSLLFESGRAALTKEGQALLDEVADALREAEGREFQVAGHTDDVPIRTWRFRSNWHLSAARAVGVTRYLIERGVPAEHLSAAGYANTQPIVEGTTEEARRANRRIEIVLLPNLDELPDLSLLDRISRERPDAEAELGDGAPAAGDPALEDDDGAAADADAQGAEGAQPEAPTAQPTTDAAEKRSSEAPGDAADQLASPQDAAPPPQGVPPADTDPAPSAP